MSDILPQNSQKEHQPSGYFIIDEFNPVLVYPPNPLITVGVSFGSCLAIGYTVKGIGGLIKTYGNTHNEQFLKSFNRYQKQILPLRTMMKWSVGISVMCMCSNLLIHDIYRRRKYDKKIGL